MMYKLRGCGDAVSLNTYADRIRTIECIKIDVNTGVEKDATHPLFGQGVRNGLEGSPPRERGCALPPRPGRASRPAGESSGRSRPD